MAAEELEAPVTGSATPDGFVHHAVVHRDHQELLDATLALLVDALAERHRVVVAAERALTRAVREALDPRVTPGSPSFASPAAVPDRSPEAFVDWLLGMLPATGRLVTLVRHGVGRHPRPGSTLAARLDALPVTLLCSCPADARPAAMEDFLGVHASVTRAPSPPPAVDVVAARASERAPVLRTTFAGLAHLRVLRPDVATTAAAAGFVALEQERAVLAVHEASVVACRLVRAAVDDGLLDADDREGHTCELTASAERHTLVVDIHLPRKVRFLPTMLDGDPLRWARTFSDAAFWTGTSRTRRLRVVLHDATP